MDVLLAHRFCECKGKSVAPGAYLANEPFGGTVPVVYPAGPRCSIDKRICRIVKMLDNQAGGWRGGNSDREGNIVAGGLDILNPGRVTGQGVTGAHKNEKYDSATSTEYPHSWGMQAL